MGALFIGLITLDCLYRADHPPQANEKVVADVMLTAAGGPATNAAVAYRQGGQSAMVVGALGQHPLAGLMREDLSRWGVTVHDLTPELTTPPPLSSIVVSAASGDRAVISYNAQDRQALISAIPDSILEGVEVILIDGHQMAVGLALATQAQAQDIPVVIDAGSWKPGFEQVLPQAQVVIASAQFRPPDGSDPVAYLHGLGVPEVAITHGADPIVYSGPEGQGQLPVPSVPVMDTLGAGDIFHGAFCRFYPRLPFVAALAEAAQVAAFACRYWGTRAWIEPYRRELRG
jgi:sugar/nucleoside kinase (ribokinase family)